jgi:hypothetical protein
MRFIMSRFVGRVADDERDALFGAGGAQGRDEQGQADQACGETLQHVRLRIRLQRRLSLD